MKRPIVLIVAFVFCTLGIEAQIWQHTYGIPSHYEICTSVVNGDYNGFIMGINRDSRAMWIVKADINGNLLWDKSIYDASNNTFIIHSIDLDDYQNIYISGGVYPSDSMLCTLIKLNNCKELEWCRRINTNKSNFGVFTKVTENNSIRLLTFGASSQSGIDRFQLWEIDPDGNIIWKKQVIPGTEYYFQNTDFSQMCLTSDGGSLLAGYTYYPYDTLNKPWDAILQPCLVKSNSQGDMQWVYPPLYGADTNRIGFFRGCTQIGDYYYAAGSNYNYGPGHFLQPLVARFDLNGNLLSYVSSGPDTMFHSLSQVLPISDTSIMLISAANKVFSDPNYLMVFIADTQGNFQKSFTRTDLVVGQFGDEVAKMRDNKFVIPCQSPIGWPGANTDIVAIKLNANLEYDSIYSQSFTYDSLCPYPIVSDTIVCNCEPFVSVKEAEKSMEKLTIAPNPAREWFTVGFPQAWQQAVTLRVYDMLGRVQYEVVMPSGTKQTKVKCEGWKPGLYLVRWQSGGKVVSGKVVVR